jgi:hypothetical protein
MPKSHVLMLSAETATTYGKDLPLHTDTFEGRKLIDRTRMALRGLVGCRAHTAAELAAPSDAFKQRASVNYGI